MVSRIDEDYAQLLGLIETHPFPPEGLLFWARHMPREGAKFWEECPRAEWLYWIAEQCGVRPIRLQRVARAVETEMRNRERAAVHEAALAQNAQNAAAEGGMAGAQPIKGRDPDAAIRTPKIDAAALVRCYLSFRECRKALSEQQLEQARAAV